MSTDAIKTQSVPVIPWAQTNGVPAVINEADEHVTWTLPARERFVDVDGFDVDVKVEAFMPLRPSRAEEQWPETTLQLWPHLCFTVPEARRLAETMLRLCERVDPR